MKIHIALLGLLLVFVLSACTPTADTSAQFEDIDPIEFDGVTLSVEDGSPLAEVELSETESALLDESASFALSDWCVAGQVYAVSSDEVEFNSELLGIVSFKDEDRCHGQTSQVIELPMDSGSMTVTTDFYISADQRSLWVVVDAMGQLTETYVVLE